MNSAIVFVTYNRFEYTVKSIPRLLNEKDEFDLYIWDNNSKDGTREYLENLDDPRIKEIVFNKSNVGTTQALNYFWKKTRAELVGKVDNDCLLVPGWIAKLTQAHKDIEDLGAVACWHYKNEDFDEARASEKVQRFGQHLIFRHPWVCGSGFLMKRKTYLKMGAVQNGMNMGMTDYFLKVALSGYINGWYYPFIIQVHMDDPLCEDRIIKDNRTLQDMFEVTYQLRAHNLRNIDDCLRRREEDLKIILYQSWKAEYYTGIRPKLYRLLKATKKGLHMLSNINQKITKS